MIIKRILLFLISAIIISGVHAQQTDTIINTGIYKSYYSYQVRNPLYVTYTLYKGGGDCNRKAFSFKACGIGGAATSDYAHTGYDKGHLANAEDFAGNCDQDELTFCYYNCVPQTVKLNRGIWKTWETRIRVLSQRKSLFIVAGAIYSNKVMGSNHIGIPDYCYKVVLDSKTKQVLYCLLFPNDNSRKVTNLTLTQLKSKLSYALVP